MANPTDIELQDLSMVQEVKYVPNDLNNEEKTTLQTIWLKIQFDPTKKRNLLIGIGVFAALIRLGCYWKDLEYQLEVPRIDPYVIPLPNSFNLAFW